LFKKSNSINPVGAIGVSGGPPDMDEEIAIEGKNVIDLDK